MALVNFAALVNLTADYFQQLSQMVVTSDGRAALVKPALEHQKEVDAALTDRKITHGFLVDSILIVLDNGYDIARDENRKAIDEYVVNKAGLEKAADFVNYLLALGTGALVFSAELIKKDYTMTSGARLLILGSWSLLAISVLGGMFAYMRIPVMLAERNYDLEDQWMIIPGRVQQIAFIIGVPLLGFALAILLLSRDLGNENALGNSSSLASADHFTIAQSAPVIGSRGRTHYHTFLLNERNGETWEMKCATNGVIEFHRVAVEGPVTPK